MAELFICCYFGALKALIFFKSLLSYPNSPIRGLLKSLKSYQQKGALKAPRIDKIVKMVSNAPSSHILVKEILNIYLWGNVIQKMPKKSPFLIQIAPPYPSLLTTGAKSHKDCFKIYLPLNPL